MGAAEERKQTFERFKKGDGKALFDLLEGERTFLYDYLMRMTGQISRAADTVDEVFQTLADGPAQESNSWQELRLLLYSTARKFNGDVWNAVTPKLENSGMTVDDDGQPLSGIKMDDLPGFRALDASLRGLKGPEREAVILRAMAAFDSEDVADIMGFGKEAVEAHFLQGMKTIDAECPRVERPEETLARLPRHKAPIRSSQMTMNLSMVMQGIKTRPSGLRSPFRIALIVMMVALLGAYLLRPDLFTFEAWKEYAPTGEAP